MVDISICIPVYCTEHYLTECLKSVALQTFTNYEIILVNDGSSGVNSCGLNCKKIVKECKKKYKLPITYLEHSKNLGVLEARRHAVEESVGKYILNLDSDDALTPNALEVLFKEAKKTGAHIVHGITNTYFYHNPEQQFVENHDSVNERQKKIQAAVSNIYNGVLENRDIFHGYLVEENHCGYLCGKLISRDVYLEAFNHIPYMFCVMADDVIQYFWISYFAKKYVSINKEVYIYNINTGITSHRIIDNLNIWKHVCSAASVFYGLFNGLNKFDIRLTEEESEKITSICYLYASNNLKQWRSVVSSEIKDEAYSLLCDFWGNDLIHDVEQEMKTKGLL